MLSTSIPQFDIYIDFMADGLREKNGKRFKENIDSLSICLANLLATEAAAEYKYLLQTGYREKDRYFLLKKKMSFKEYQQLKNISTGAFRAEIKVALFPIKKSSGLIHIKCLLIVP